MRCNSGQIGGPIQLIRLAELALDSSMTADSDLFVAATPDALAPTDVILTNMTVGGDLLHSVRWVNILRVPAVGESGDGALFAGEILGSIVVVARQRRQIGPGFSARLIQPA